eukprot:scaffold99485_cov45-Phaeocystis_antarctica.AAC.1
MWNSCLTNDYQPILAAFSGRQGRTIAFLEGAKLGKSVEHVPILQEKTELSLSRALLVPGGVATGVRCDAGDSLIGDSG